MAEHAGAADYELSLAAGLADREGAALTPDSAVQSRVIIDPDAAGDADVGGDSRRARTEPPDKRAGHRSALLFGVVSAIVLTLLTGWLGYRTVQAHQTQSQRAMFVQVARQGALNLTTIDYQRVDADVQRILDSATGTFHDDFQKRAQPFIDVIGQARSKTQGNVTEAGLESEQDNQAQVLVAVTVNTSNAGTPEQAPRAWRMRIDVQKVGGGAKISNVEFVP